MNPSSMLSRLRGLTIAGFGASWEPSESERDIAGRVISFLEDRRVLFNDYELEVPGHCVDSIIEIRSFLTEQLGELKTREASIADNIRGIRAACREFLDTVQKDDGQIIIESSFEGGPQNWTFYAALGELRATVGMHVAVISAKHNLSVNSELANILPPKSDAD